MGISCNPATFSPVAFLCFVRVLRDCHVGLWPPRNDKFESIVRSTMPTYHLPACMAVTDRRYRCNRFLRFYRQPVQVGSTAQGAARRSPTAHVCLLFSQNYSLFIFQYL